jgi:hypothetical protein
MGIKAKNYVLREHNINNIIDDYERLINDKQLAVCDTKKI